MTMEHWWNDTDTRNRSTRRETCLSAALSTTNPTWNNLSSKVFLLGERMVTESGNGQYWFRKCQLQIQLDYWVGFFTHFVELHYDKLQCVLPFYTAENNRLLGLASRARKLSNCSGDRKPGG